MVPPLVIKCVIYILINILYHSVMDQRERHGRRGRAIMREYVFTGIEITIRQERQVTLF